jgi:hypothetical protein
MPRGHTPLGAHGGEPDAVDVRGQAAEDEAGELHRDVRPRRRPPAGRRLVHGCSVPCSTIDKTARRQRINRNPEAKSTARGPRERRWTQRRCVEHLACANGSEGRWKRKRVGRRVQGKEWRCLRSKTRGGGFALLLLLTAVPAKAGVAAAGRAGMERVEPSGGGLGQCDCVRLNG